MYILSIESSYPEGYWLLYENKEPKRFNFMQCVKVETKEPLIFKSFGKVSEHNFLRYDFFCCGDGPPEIISPRFASILEKNAKVMQCIQLIDAHVIINKETLLDYKVVNILSKISCVDTERSISKLVLRNKPDGPVYFEKVILKQIGNNDTPIFRAAEDLATVVVTDEFKILCEQHQIKGTSFLSE